MLGFYEIATFAVVHVCWNISLVVLAHMFQEIQRQCKIIYLKNAASQHQQKSIMCLRKMHQRCCKLLRDYNNVYSLQVLFEISRLFLMLVFNFYRIVMHLANVGVANFPIIDKAAVALLVYNLFGIVANAHICVHKVCTVKCMIWALQKCWTCTCIYIIIIFFVTKQPLIELTRRTSYICE